MRIVQVEHSVRLPIAEVPRSIGVHLSAIIRSISIRMGFLDRKWCEDLSLSDVSDITDPASILRICIGLAWEKWFVSTLPDVVDHPGELQVDGIYMTPDGESVDVIVTSQGERGKLLETIVHEFKTTYKSTNTVGGMEEQWMWLTQLKGYCKGLRSVHAKIYILFLCGDYSWPITPLFRAFEIWFEQEEIDETWDLLREYMEVQLAIDQAAIAQGEILT